MEKLETYLYYAVISPIKGVPLEGAPPAPPGMEVLVQTREGYAGNHNYQRRLAIENAERWVLHLRDGDTKKLACYQPKTHRVTLYQTRDKQGKRIVNALERLFKDSQPFTKVITKKEVS